MSFFGDSTPVEETPVVDAPVEPTPVVEEPVVDAPVVSEEVMPVLVDEIPVSEVVEPTEPQMFRGETVIATRIVSINGQFVNELKTLEGQTYLTPIED
jgi:hypothetical protein